MADKKSIEQLLSEMREVADFLTHDDKHRITDFANHNAYKPINAGVLADSLRKIADAIEALSQRGCNHTGVRP